MASARRTDKALHPTNLHVNQSLFPNDTVQSRLPDPGWLERWLDEQIQFDKEWETKVVERILHNLSLLFERTFNSVQDLNRYRKEIAGTPAARWRGAANRPDAPQSAPPRRGHPVDSAPRPAGRNHPWRHHGVRALRFDRGHGPGRPADRRRRRSGLAQLHPFSAQTTAGPAVRRRRRHGALRVQFARAGDDVRQPQRRSDARRPRAADARGSRRGSVALQCGCHPPSYFVATETPPPVGADWMSLHHNCSGKHAGFLAYCPMHDQPFETYLDRAIRSSNTSAHRGAFRATARAWPRASTAAARRTARCR